MSGSIASGARQERTGFEWLDAWQRRRGKPLRVLHIGNIANNAYNNARLQQRYGIDAHVLCHNYYHTMACPEWEDADFRGEILDPFYPDWWSVDLRGFKRPRWFAQGPLIQCVEYLAAHADRTRAARRLWRRLELERRLLCRKGPTTRALRWAMRAARKGKRMIERPSLPPIDAPISSDAGGSLADLLAAPASGVTAPEWREQIEGYFRAFWDSALPAFFSRYDIIQAYATYTIMPYLAGRRDYLAYEHGTIRSIPFADTVEGRCCNATYRAARLVFVTNSDNVESAEKLGLAPARIVNLPHAFDSDKLERYADEHPIQRGSSNDPTLFFSPARQDWVSGDPGWSKGNDRLLHAAALLKSQGIRFLLILVQWGRDLQASRELIASLGIEDSVQWRPTMKKRELWQQYMQADCVIDQFVVPAIGGVTFEAMMLGRRVITAIDRNATRRFFGETPPLDACENVQEIAAAMLAVVGDRADRAGRGRANRAWMRKYHSAERIVRLQADAYRTVLDHDTASASVLLGSTS
ncbi:MAG: glycosyltransferase family 4 protein [Burkholderiales bacterium]|nr:glycosyltransferase family 4 protein [Burkholderiales bacterium]